MLQCLAGNNYNHRGGCRAVVRDITDSFGPLCRGSPLRILLGEGGLRPVGGEGEAVDGEAGGRAGGGGAVAGAPTRHHHQQSRDQHPAPILVSAIQSTSTPI